VSDIPPPGSGHFDVTKGGGVVGYMARNGVAANLLAAFLLIAGIISYGTIVQELFPDSSLDTVQVSVVYPGATPEEVEESVVQKIEEAIESVEGVKEIRSTAAEGLGTVLVELELGTDIARALDDIKSEVDQIQTFPGDAEEPDVRELTTRRSVMQIALYGNVNEDALKRLAYQLEDELSALSEVSYVETSSVRDYEVSIEVPQDTLRAYGLSLTDVSRAVAANSLDSPAGSIDTDSEEVRIRTIGQNYGQQDFEDIVLISRSDGTNIRLGDIATVVDAFEDNDLSSYYNGTPVAFVEVFRTSDERVLDIAEQVELYLEEEFAQTLPENISYAIWNDDSELLADRLSLLLKNAAIGLALVLIALALFLNIRLALWVAFGIAITFVGAIAVLDAVGSSINMFSLFGFILALGLVVDDAIVVGENIYAEREQGRRGLSAAILGANRVTVPVIFAVLTTVAAFSPLFAIGGAIGKILFGIPLVVVTVLALSLIESLLILPNHLSHLPPPDHKPRSRVIQFFDRTQKAVDKRFQQFVDGPLDRALRFAVDAPAIILAGALALVIIVMALVPAGILKVGFFPEVEGEIVSATLEMPAGTPVERTAETAHFLEAQGREVIAEIEGEQPEDAADLVRGIRTTIGQTANDSGPIISTSTSPSIASIQFRLQPPDEREISAADFENAWRDAVGPVPEARSLVFASDLFSAGAPVSVELSHPDMESLARISEELMVDLARFEGIFDIETDQDSGLQEIQIRLKPAARTLGVSLQDVAGQVRAAFFGNEAVRVQRGREDVRVYIRLPEAERNSIVDVEGFRVAVPGGQVVLSEIADVSFGESPSIIRRQDGRRVVTVTANVDTTVVTSQEIARQLEGEVLPALQANHSQLLYTFGGEQAEQQESFGDLGIAFLAAILMIYILLAVPFKSYVQPLIIIAVIPFGIVGALLGHLILGLSVGILSMFGIIGLSGVIVNGSLILIDFINERLREGDDIRTAIITSAKSRFRPIALTSVTTFLGVAPITFETSLQAQFLIPMSASLGFGVLFGTVILMLLIPALAMLQYRANERIKRRFSKNRATASAAAS
jgi:multidrug efflux pump subunit AcrB